MALKEERIIVIDPDKCTGCHSCEMACSMKHFHLNNPLYSRIRIHEFRDVNTFIPVMCQACEDAPCMKVCPMNARIRLESGAVVTDENLCIGCKACISACPFGAPVINPDTGKTISCDLCMGDELGPWCVFACTMQEALRFVDAKDAAKAKGRQWAKITAQGYEPPAVSKDIEWGASFD